MLCLLIMAWVLIISTKLNKNAEHFVNGKLSQVVCHENHENFSHQKPNFKAKMHQIPLRRPIPHWRAYSAPQAS